MTREELERDVEDKARKLAMEIMGSAKTEEVRRHLLLRAALTIQRHLELSLAGEVLKWEVLEGPEQLQWQDEDAELLFDGVKGPGEE